MNIAESFAYNLRRKRTALGITQKKLGEMLGYSEKSVSKWESGRAIPPSELLPKLSELFRTSIDDLFYNRAGPSYYLGIDGGGTKTDFLLVDGNGGVINRITLGECNPVDIGLEKTFEVLESGIRKVCSGILPDKVSMFAGIAGGITGDNRRKIADFLNTFHFCRYDNDSDAVNAVKTALGDSDGITVILGTGDIAFTQVDGQLFRTGGFGYLFDSGGSAYSIGRDAILYALRNEQLDFPETALTKRLKQHFGTDLLLPRLSEIYRGGKKYIASCAPAVFDAYNTGDTSAKEILENIFASASGLIADASFRLMHKDSIDVRLVGSVSGNDCVLPMIQRQLALRDTNKKYNISVCTSPPVTGAVMLAGYKGEIKNA